MTVVTPSKIVCVGRHYVAHAREMGNEVPAVPMLFLKPPSAVIGPGEPIVLPPESVQVEYEAEIGVVIGRRVRRASPDDAVAAIRGFTCVNDVTARQASPARSSRRKGLCSKRVMSSWNRCRSKCMPIPPARRAQGWSKPSWTSSSPGSRRAAPAA